IALQYLLYPVNEQDKMVKKEMSVCQQIQALLYKNFLKKWRIKRESLLPPKVLGSVDQFNDSGLVVAYTPVSNVTQRIMIKMASASFMKGV
ncbi:hypothetical protein H8959_019620, partial [Pygathrix nigripes]